MRYIIYFCPRLIYLVLRLLWNLKVQHTNKKIYHIYFRGISNSSQFQKNCKNSAYQKQALISLGNTRIQAVFEIRSQLTISW